MSQDPSREEVGEDREEPAFETISQSLGEPRRELLTAFLESDKSVLNTSELREHTTVPSGSMIHHLDRLTNWGLVMEESGREYHGHGGSNARTWALTDRGETFCADHLDAPPSTFLSPEEVTNLKEQVTALEEDVDLLGGLLVRLAVDTEMISEERGTEILEEVGGEA